MMCLFSFTICATEKVFNDETLVLESEHKAILVASSRKLYSLDDVEEDTSCCLRCFTACFPWWKGKIGDLSPVITGNVKCGLAKEHLNLPLEIILTIANFLDYSEQLKFSHVSKTLQNCIGEDFWRRQIRKQKYLIWNDSLPMARIFFANYFYHRGFGIHPQLPEKVVHKREDIVLLPSFKLAEKALNLGFPKGETNYRQAQHKRYTLRTDQKGTYNTFLQECLRDESKQKFKRGRLKRFF